MKVFFRSTLPHSPNHHYGTALWKQSHSGSWAPPSAQDLKWDYHIDSITKRPSRGCISFAKWGSLTFHRNSSPSSTQPLFSLSCVHLTVWFDSATKSGIRILQQTARPTEKIIGTPQPNHQDMYTSRIRKRTEKNHSGPSHPVYFLFILFAPLAGATEHWAPKQPGTKQLFYCTSVHNFSKRFIYK